LAAGPAALIASRASAQLPAVPPAAVQQFQQVVGDRVELVSILAGDYGAAGGIYTFRGGNVADISISRIGGRGDVASPQPIGVGDLQWAPVLQGSIGWVSAENEFNTGYLLGNRTTYDMLAVAGGGGVSLYLTDRLKLSSTIGGIYGHVENQFSPRNPTGEFIKFVATGTLVDWTMDTWSVVPAMAVSYQWPWSRTLFEFSSRYNFFHTESFSSTTALLGVNGDSHTWDNKLDVDVPLGVSFLGRELRTGGFFQRTDVFGNAAKAVRSDYIYTANGRLVLDFLGHPLKLRWLGLGASYFWGHNSSGWSAGIDMKFMF